MRIMRRLGIALLMNLVGCVRSTQATRADSGDSSDGTEVSTGMDAAHDSAVELVDAETVAPDEDAVTPNDRGVDFFTTSGCSLRGGTCVAGRDGVRCDDLFAGRLRDAAECLEYGIIGCMENVRGTAPAAICMSRLEADGTTARYVVFSQYAYEMLAQQSRYAVTNDQCGSAFGWPFCPTR